MILISIDGVNNLIAHGEDCRVDFKQTLRFQTPYDKAELVKDVMAFVNGHDRGTAYILYGIDNCGVVVGINDRIPDEASLQQLLGSSIDQPVRFAFYIMEINGLQIAVLEIPESGDRFHVAAKDIIDDRSTYFLRKGELCIRRGTSKMPLNGRDFKLLKEDFSIGNQPKPELDVCFAGGGKHMDTIRNWPTPERVLHEILSVCIFPPEPGQWPYKMVPLRFYVHNNGQTVADPILVDLTFPSECHVLFSPIEERPLPGWTIKVNRNHNSARLRGANLVHGDDHAPGEIYVRFLRRDTTYEIKWKASAGNMVNPTEGVLSVCIMPTSE